ncbi:MAG: C4-type zinc ribbon domain-containing protein [Candidatus Didemnitutus sp.]|nr:C4-type zinc ribbon domain-containing protein [Candidatus Didemnitutus sp.]
MVVVDLSKLRNFQERDLLQLSLGQQIEAVPRDIAGVVAKIASERSAIETAKAEWIGLEAKKKTLETEIKSAEGQVAKYRTQQLEVRKNDEYRALTHEIETVEATIDSYEEEELKILYAIDEAKKRFVEAEAVLKGNISGHEARIAALGLRLTELEKENAAAVAALEQARAEVPETQLRLYERLARSPGRPVCVAVHHSRCDGCHMKVSANVEFEARKGENITTCDQCGRIVYWQL